jgi:hypothetical protein
VHVFKKSTRAGMQCKPVHVSLCVYCDSVLKKGLSLMYCHQNTCTCCCEIHTQSRSNGTATVLACVCHSTMHTVVMVMKVPSIYSHSLLAHCTLQPAQHSSSTSTHNTNQRVQHNLIQPYYIISLHTRVDYFLSVAYKCTKERILYVTRICMLTVITACSE